MEETPDRSGNSGMSGLKVVFFFPLLPEEDIIKVVVDFFLFKRGGEAGKKCFQPMRKKLGKIFGVVFSFAVVVTDTELPSWHVVIFCLILKVVGFEYCGVGVSLVLAMVTGTISGTQPILR